MIRSLLAPLALALALLMPIAGMAQDSITVLPPPGQKAPDTPAAPPEPAKPCGTRAIDIARMPWPSAAILAEIHARLLAQQFGCTVKVVAGDLAGTGSSMGSTGDPAVAPELWLSRIADIWNAGVKAEKVRQAAPTYDTATLEGWYIPGYVAETHPELTDLAAFSAYAQVFAANGGRLKFISCPADWACAVINRNLIAAAGLTAKLDVVTPADRFEMDRLIADAVSRKQPFAFYYWQPNAIISQFAFRAIDLGAYDHDAFQCLGRQVCSAGKVSAFAPEPVVVAVSDWVFTQLPNIAFYFQRASLPIAAMDEMLMQMSEPGATVESVADRFVAEHKDIWGKWVGAPG
jgi:glycine betaine/proline transport system substrate-binding protein